MFRLLMNAGGKKGGTFRSLKDHTPGSKRKEYSDMALRTLGSGDLRGRIKIHF